MDKELESFFLTVVNYSLSENIEKYLECLKDITVREVSPASKDIVEYFENYRDTSETDPPIPEFVKEYLDNLYSFSGMLNHGRYAHDLYIFLSQCQEGKIESRKFTDEELSSFEQNRGKIIKILERAISGLYVGDVTNLKEYKKIIAIANSLLPSRKFVMCKNAGIKLQKAEFRLWGGRQWENSPHLIDYKDVSRSSPPSSSDLSQLYDLDGILVLNGVLSLTCYCLCLALADSQRLKMKRCPYCKHFFTAKDTKRRICYEAACINAYHKEDMQSRRDKDPMKYC